MRVLGILLCLVTVPASAVRSADDEDKAAVRKQGERYAALLRQGDKAGLEELLHKDYQARSLPGVENLSRADKPQGIAHWLRKRFTRLEVRADGVRVFGNTAIETGALSAQLKEYGSDSTWRELPYTRVWVREGKGWRLAHEQF
jgi:ketosteroid isomerase-like protein